jgi:hypothetical protein
MSELVESFEFFAPVSTGMIEGMVAGYQAMRHKIEQVAALFQGDRAKVVDYFIDGNRRMDNSRYSSLSAEQIFRLDGAVASLNAEYWRRAMAATDVWDYMPQARRDEWNKSILDMTCPDFEEETVRATLQTLIHSRAKFFAERVDGIFRALSHEHVTNNPMGFGKRMIINYAMDGFGSINSSRAGYVNDLRCVIAKFMGRDEPGWGASTHMVRDLKSCFGEWRPVDGNAFRIRLYKKGTVHLEVHPDMAWRLNAVLASLYPAAIPSQFRTPPKTKPKDFVLMDRPLPFAVIEALYNSREFPGNKISCYISDKHLRAEVGHVLEAIGGVHVGLGDYQFDFNPKEVIQEIARTGCIPDSRSYQFYPTPADLAEKAVELADIGPEHACLEPSAGNGGLADFMPKDRTTCIELNDLRCKVLDAKGHRWMQADFLALDLNERYDRIVMNPPFADNRWWRHTEKAVSLLKPGGRLVAILPESAKKSDLLPGVVKHWHGPWSFPGTSISVVMLVVFT